MPFVVSRQQAVVDINVLSAMALGHTVDRLCDLHHAQFPTPRGYERRTCYDHTMHIVLTSKRGLVGLMAKRRSDLGDHWKAVTDPTYLTCPLSKTFEDNPLPGGPHERMITCQGPFAHEDREADYRHIWAAFAERSIPTAMRNKP